ncbi:TRAP transporter small permease [Acuticoccus sp. M5D2P5]|uniref:TRAP transporter small permease n=1 Tax=Acuticoccus kalidii TaxID=2910977 RepID=UPI001F33A3B1|nr:TRAP transporter small permease [Acuticoccus kalidii]MCF3934958.1 TRAP transporter small permease [Acuticoccus kalidii]
MRALWTSFIKLHDALTTVAFVLGTVMLVVITGSYVYEVVARYFFTAPTKWAADLVGYALCAGVFLLLPKVTATRGHVAVTLIFERVGKATEKRLLRFIDLLGAVFCGYAAWLSFNENVRQAEKGIMTIANQPIPKYWVTGFITFGLLLAAIHFLRHVVRPPDEAREALQY